MKDIKERLDRLEKADETIKECSTEDPEQLDLHDRLLASAGFTRVPPGMMVWHPDFGDGKNEPYSTDGFELSDRAGVQILISHPASKGILLDMIRKHLGNEVIFLVPNRGGEGVRWGWYGESNRPLGVETFSSEEEALVYALEYRKGFLSE